MMEIAIIAVLTLVVGYLVYEVRNLRTTVEANTSYTTRAFETLRALVYKEVKGRVEAYLHKSEKEYHNWNIYFDKTDSAWKVQARFDDKSGSLLLAEEVLDLNTILMEIE